MKTGCKQHAQESTSQLKAYGLKVTSARLGLLDIFKHAKKPISVAEVAEKLKGTAIDLVTLYRNVESLEKLGLLKQIRLDGRQTYYELAGDHHHHIICEKCGKISDIKKCVVELPKAEIKNAEFASVKNHSLEFFGICDKCVNKKS